jgi:ubiquinone/menaquinone biosynthesis C-methylase UbiE
MSTTEYVKTYTLDNAAQGERDRLRLVEEAWDPGSIAHFERLGVREGDHVLMVAGGGGSLVEWMAQRVGSTGRVVAIDLDPRFLEPLAEQYANVEVYQRNVVTQELPAGEFDLVHTRLLVAWLPERVSVIEKMTVAVKPGGTLMIEDMDSASWGPAYPNEATDRVRAAAMRFLDNIGYDTRTGRRLPGWFKQAGLEDVDAHGSVLTFRGSSDTVVPFYLYTFRQSTQLMLDMQLVSEDDIAQVEERYADPAYDGLAHTMITAWGRKPAAA